jgi:lipopolysaccharide/colanic/teichoic acid biosynthesis glycosyltransferase
MIRRAVDVIVGLVALVGLAPVLVAISIAVVVDSPGGPLYGGVRVGKDRRPFRMWKFRTMVAGADRIGPGITGTRDPRITRLGAALRRTKLDELPQFFNLLRGELTLVGPRAEVPSIVDLYTQDQLRTLAVIPGITGPGQLHYTTDQQEEIPEDASPDEYYVRHLLGPKLEIDLAYLRERNAWTDARVVLRTVGVVLSALGPARRS